MEKKRRRKKSAAAPDPGRCEAVRLSDGRELWLRPVHPADAGPIAGAFDLLSEDEVRRRYLHPVKALAPVYLAQLVGPEPGRSYVVVAAEPLPPGEALVGAVARVDLDPGSYLARVTITVDPTVRLPDDTAALISSESLMGGKYMALEPGASEDMLSPGGHIQYTQAPQNLEQLLGQFIFSMQKDDKGEKTAAAEPAPAPAPAPAPVQAAPSPAPAAVDETPARDEVAAPAPKFAPAAPMQVPMPEDDTADDEPAAE